MLWQAFPPLSGRCANLSTLEYKDKQKTMMNRIKRLLQVPDTHYTAREIFRWLWIAWRGNRKQAVLNAVIGILGVGVSLAAVGLSSTPLMWLPMSWREVSMRR